MNNDKTLNFTTTCKTCIFADVKDGKQVDCIVGKLDLYLNKGKANKDGDFYVIQGICQSCRNNEWLKSLPENFDHVDLVKKIKKENRVTHDLFIDYCSDIDKLNNLLVSMKTLGNIFDNIYVITLKPDFKEIEKVVKNTYPDAKFLAILDILNDKEKIVSQRVSKSKSFFFSYVNTSFEPKYNYTEKLTDFIVEKANEVSVLIDDDILTSQVLLYKMLIGSEKPFLEAVEELCRIQETEMIKNWSCVCE